MIVIGNILILTRFATQPSQASLHLPGPQVDETYELHSLIKKLRRDK